MLGLAAMAAMAAFTSCERDPDVDRSMIIAGDWTGDFGMYYYDGRYEIDADYTDLTFIPAYEYATHGTGIQVDHYHYPAPYAYIYYRFNWRIYHGMLRLTYPYDHSLDVDIYEYDMTSRYFTGRVGNTGFKLYKINDYYDWGPYTHDYGYGYGDWYNGGYYGYYANTRSADATDEAEPQIKVGNRFKEGK